jgi:hypothetical protein
LAVLAAPFLAGASKADDQDIRFAPAEANVARVNQQLADEIARNLQNSGRLAGYNLDIAAEGGVITLSGSVSNIAQKAEAVGLARAIPGVVAVEDKIAARSGSELVTVNFEPQPPKASVGIPAGNLPTGANNGGKVVVEPAPSHAFPGGLAPYSDTPALPPYSWPAYTPYNNFASMAYQTQYPSGAWPFIGPPHPYPMIPSGWRSVNLRWKRGYWYLKFNAF